MHLLQRRPQSQSRPKTARPLLKAAALLPLATIPRRVALQRHHPADQPVHARSLESQFRHRRDRRGPSRVSQFRLPPERPEDSVQALALALDSVPVATAVVHPVVAVEEPPEVAEELPEVAEAVLVAEVVQAVAAVQVEAQVAAHQSARVAVVAIAKNSSQWTFRATAPTMHQSRPGWS